VLAYRMVSLWKAATRFLVMRNEPTDLKTLFKLQKLPSARITLAVWRIHENKAHSRAEPV